MAVVAAVLAAGLVAAAVLAVVVAAVLAVVVPAWPVVVAAWPVGVIVVIIIIIIIVVAVVVIVVVVVIVIIVVAAAAATNVRVAIFTTPTYYPWAISSAIASVSFTRVPKVNSTCVAVVAELITHVVTSSLFIASVISHMPSEVLPAVKREGLVRFVTQMSLNVTNVEMPTQGPLGHLRFSSLIQHQVSFVRGGGNAADKGGNREEENDQRLGKNHWTAG